MQAIDEGLKRGSSVHVAALMGAPGVVCNEPIIEHGLHLLDGLEPGSPPLDTEVLVEHGAMEALDYAVGLRTLDPCGAVFDLFQLQEELIGMLIWPPQNSRPLSESTTSILPPWASKVGSTSLLSVYGGNRQLGGVESGPGMAGMAIDGRLHVDLADPLQSADEEGVDRHQRLGMAGLDMALPELGREALQEFDLFLRERDLALGGLFLQAQQTLGFGEQIVALPHPANAAGGDLQPLQAQFPLDAWGAVAGMVEGVGEHRRLNLGRHPVGVRTSRAGQTIDQAIGAISLEVASDLVELLPGIAHHLAGSRYVRKFVRKIQQ